MNSHGFTLVELLIVISIISILALIGLISYQSILKNARDGQRKTDLNILQSSLEQYRFDQNFYPLAVNLAVVAALTNAIGNPTSPSTPRTYLSKTPVDPQGGVAYQYQAVPSGCNNQAVKCSSYCIYAKFEKTPTTTWTADCPGQTNYNYFATKP